MKKKIALITALFILLLVGGWTTNTPAVSPSINAADNDLDTILARSAAKGYLSSLTRGETIQSTLANFYLSDETAQTEIAQDLTTLPVEDYQLIGETWLDDNTYRVTALLTPNDQVLLIDVSKVGNRWRITGLAWGEGITVSAATDSTSTNANSSAANTASNTPVANAEVLAGELNVRSGPGVAYPPISTLKSGETVDVTGINALGAWYQVSQNGEPLGWISASPTFVKTSPANAEIPIVAAPALPGGFEASGGKMILQPQTAGDFYLYDGSSLKKISSGIDPALSPDGAKVAFTRWQGVDGLGSVWIHDLETGKEWSVLGETLQAKAPAWSPDGSELVINFQNGGRREIEEKCKSLRSDGSFPSIPHRAYDIKFKNGKLCYKLPPDTFWQLRKVNVASGDFEDLASQTYSYAPVWDPANDWRVVFSSGAGLQQLDLNRNEYFPFGPGDFRDRTPSFSPDGKTVVVAYKGHNNNWQIHAINAATGERTALTSTPFLAETPINNTAPVFSPDGKQIAFITDRTGKWEYWVMNADGSNPRPLLSAELADQLDVQYNGVDERLISWGK